MLHCFSQTRWMTSPSRHRTGQKTGWKEPDSALPSSVCPKLQAWVVPGACWKERSASGTKTTSSRIPSTFTLVGERLEDDEPSFEAAVFKGPAEPLGALLEGFAEPLHAILWGLAGPLGFITMAQTNLLKMDRVQNEARRVTLATTKDTPIETIRFMLDFQLTQTRQKVKQAKAYFSAVENPHNTSIKCYPCPPLDFDSGGDSRTTHAIILTDSLSRLQKVKNGMVSPNWSMSMVDIHLRKLLWVYCPGQAGVKGNDKRGPSSIREKFTTCFDK